MTVASIYIPHFEKTFDPNFIAISLDKKGIAKVSRIAIESYPKNHPLHNSCQKAYVDIKEWHDTESAYNFIKRLVNSRLETRFNHSDDNWWVVHINKFPHKTNTSYKNSALIVYQLPDYASDDVTYISDYREYENDEISILTDEYTITIDANDFNDYMSEIIDQRLDYAEYLADF
jgi:hypothetical protein